MKINANIFNFQFWRLNIEFTNSTMSIYTVFIRIINNDLPVRTIEIRLRCWTERSTQVAGNLRTPARETFSYGILHIPL